ncbi:MAG: hypothetical protein LBL31_04680 [Spirochaetaceae bacterium]|nr:hypothetical protein [Spirochaetaceae bacterium]
MSKDTATIKLAGISKGDRITVTVLAACSSTGTVTLRDDSAVYATFQKTGASDRAQFLGYETAVCGGGDNLRVELDVTHSFQTMKLKPLVNFLAVSNPAGTLKGGSYTIAVEDLPDGEDYNDYVITVLSTKKANA